MKEVPLTQGRIALVDDADLPLVTSHRWHYHPHPHNPENTGYARTTIQGKNVLMHRFILGLTDPSVEVDHENGDGLDNQRANLRRATKGQNMANRRKKLGTSSRYKGVSWYASKGRWSAEIRVDGQKVFLGYFDDETAAARAYDAAATAHRGPHALLNSQESS